MSNASNTGLTIAWEPTSGNGLAISGYRIDAVSVRNEIQTVWLNVDQYPTLAGTNGGSFRLQMSTNASHAALLVRSFLNAIY